MNENETDAFCVRLNSHDSQSMIYVIVNFVMFYAIPLIFMTTIYMRISIVLWKSSNPREFGGLRICQSSGCSAPSRAVPRGTTANPATVVTNTRGVACYERESSSKATYCSTASAAELEGGGKRTTEARSNNGVAMTCLDQNRHSGGGGGGGVGGSNGGGLNNLKPKTGGHPPIEIAAVTVIHQQRRSSVVARGGGKTADDGKTRKVSSPLIARRKVIRLLIAFVVCFALCMLPHHAFLLWQTCSGNSSFDHSDLYVSAVAFILFYANSAVNPFLYAFFSNSFRKALREFLTCTSEGGRHDHCCGNCRRSLGHHWDN